MFDDVFVPELASLFELRDEVDLPPPDFDPLELFFVPLVGLVDPVVLRLDVFAFVWVLAVLERLAVVFLDEVLPCDVEDFEALLALDLLAPLLAFADWLPVVFDFDAVWPVLAFVFVLDVLALEPLVLLRADDDLLADVFLVPWAEPLLLAPRLLVVLRA